MKPFNKLSEMIDRFLHNPLKVLWVCCGVMLFSLFLDGSFFQLWSLHREDIELEQRMTDIRKQTARLNMNIERSSDPEFIEKEALNRLELAGKGDLIFVFTDELEVSNKDSIN